MRWTNKPGWKREKRFPRKNNWRLRVAGELSAATGTIGDEDLVRL